MPSGSRGGADSCVLFFRLPVILIIMGHICVPRLICQHSSPGSALCRNSTVCMGVCSSLRFPTALEMCWEAKKTDKNQHPVIIMCVTAHSVTELWIMNVTDGVWNWWGVFFLGGGGWEEGSRQSWEGGRGVFNFILTLDSWCTKWVQPSSSCLPCL